MKRWASKETNVACPVIDGPMPNPYPGYRLLADNEICAQAHPVGILGGSRRLVATTADAGSCYQACHDAGYTIPYFFAVNELSRMCYWYACGVHVAAVGNSGKLRYRVGDEKRLWS